MCIDYILVIHLSSLEPAPILVFHALVHAPAHHCILTEDAVSPVI